MADWGRRALKDQKLSFCWKFVPILTIDKKIVGIIVGNFVFLAPCSMMPEFGPDVVTQPSK